MIPADRPATAAGDEAVYLGLGSNQGDRLAHLRAAVAALARHPALEVTAVSAVYETEYVGPGEPQDPYLNACIALRTALAPAALLVLLKELEARQGRRPDGHLRPRPLDLDILVHGVRVADDPALTLPHPRLRERAFVLAPLREIAPELRLPDSGETVTAACARICARSGPAVRRLGELGPPEGDQ
ncbi:MAG: 2-amino-4-hydroxy-6-hydroxymethyldihydropteridine diphosphokinase [Candidatus Krumholzibacteriia bacterium]